MNSHLITPIILASMVLLGAGCSPSQPQANHEDAQPATVTETPLDKTDEISSANTEAFKIEGRWQSVDDKESIIEFSNLLKIDYYGDLLMSEAAYQLEEDILRVDSIDGELLYTVIKISQDTLVLSYTDRGNTLNYTRITE